MCSSFVVLMLSLALVNASSLMDFIDDDRQQSIRRRTPGCVLGDQFYNLEEEWNPVMPPYGRMICIRCRCLPVMKKGRLARKGMLTCADISDQCPPINCEDPVLLTGRCCKTCRGQDAYDYLTRENEQRYLRDYRSEGLIFADDAAIDTTIFTSLLIGLNSSTSSAVANGRFSLHKSSLYYTVDIDGLNSPTLLMIKVNMETILFENAIEQYEAGAKLCGVWKNVPSIFRNYLKTGLLQIVIATKEYEKGEIGGVIKAIRETERATFSAILRTSDQSVRGTGGLALLEVSSNGDKITYTVLVKRSEPNEKETVRARILFNEHVVHQKEFIMSTHDEIFTQTWDELSSRDSRRLSKRRLFLQLATSSGLTMSGEIRVRPVCETLQGVLSGHDTENYQKTNAAGSALFSIDDRGFIQYKIRLEGLPNRLDSLSLHYPSTGRRTDSIPETNIAKDFVPDVRGTSGWAIGIYEKPRAVEIHKLLTDQVYVSVEVAGIRGAILSGSVTKLQYNPYIDTWSDSPFLLTGADVTPNQPHGAAGHAWMSLSSDNCVLYYQIVTSGLSSSQSSSAQEGMADLGEYSRGKEPQVQPLNDFVGHVVVGDADNIGDPMYEALNAGQAFIQVSTNLYKNGEIRSNITVPNMCKKSREVGMVEDVKRMTEKSCSDGGKVYKEYEIWSPRLCETCTCKGGLKTCETEVCPELSCPKTETPSDACCPICTSVTAPFVDDKDDNSDSCFFNGDQKWHKRGSKWHPYLFPFGYSRCAVCQCKEEDNSVECHRISCEPLSCPASVAIKREMECCQICPENWASEFSDNPERQRDIGNAISCKIGDSTVHDGAEWNPKVVGGVLRCVKCKCQRGNVKCEREVCPGIDCPGGRLVRYPGVCCPTCAISASKRSQPQDDENTETGNKRNAERKQIAALPDASSKFVEKETKRTMREKRRRRKMKEQEKN